MDQTPLFFSYESSTTLEKRGTKTIFVCKLSNSTKRATAALTVTAAGDFLTPMAIFKGKPDGKIVERELPTFDPTSIYTCQDAAWMDERTMFQWVDVVFAAYLAANPPLEGIIPVLLLDLYRCHMMTSVVSRIQAIGVEVIHIPGGCTGMCKPSRRTTTRYSTAMTKGRRVTMARTDWFAGHFFYILFNKKIINSLNHYSLLCLY
jgi:hypothetical protein